MNATKGAMKAAEIIMGDKHRIRTDYGEKTIYGLADLIDRETTAPELLAVCKQTWHYIHSRQRPGDDGERDNPSYTINIIEKCLSEAISKAEGRA